MKDIAEYIEPIYNQRRRHSTLGNLALQQSLNKSINKTP